MGELCLNIYSKMKVNHVRKMKDRCPKSVGDAKQTLEIRVSQKEATKDADGNKSEDVLLCRYLSCTSTMIFSF